MLETNERIARERQFHDRRFTEDSERQQKVGKFYKITKSIKQEYETILANNSPGAKVIEYGCGKGSYAVKIARNQAELITGIDISPVAIEVAKQQAARENLSENIDFEIMNAENLEFEANSCDFICGSGILHHLDLTSAVKSITRTLKPTGKAVFLEPLGHNFLINLYRRLTPNIRSQDEHPLLEKDLRAIKNNFKRTKIRYFYLTSLAASSIAGKPGFEVLLNICESIDNNIAKAARN